jgi:molybdopterin-containing oxidoreductase family membrane subunit
MTTISHATDYAGAQPRRWYGPLLILWLVLVALGTLGVAMRISQGHLPAGYGSYVPWGLWVALYFHGVGIAGGAFVIGAGAFVLDLPGFGSKAMLRAVIVLSIAAIIPAFMGVWLDLGHMERAYRIFFTPAFTSMMAFNAWMYGGFCVVAAVCWLLSYKQRSEWLKPLLCLAVLLSVMFPSQSGAFFGVVDAKAFWHSALLPMLFLASAITAGGATLLVLRLILNPDPSAIRTLRNVTIIGLIVYFVFEFAEFSIALWNPTSHAPAIELVLWGPYWWVFWIIHLLLGGIVPLVLFGGKRSHAAWTVAALLVAITFVSTRLNVLVPGQAVGEIRGLQDAFHHDRLNYIYHATAMEYLVGLFLLAVGMAVFFIGQKISMAVAKRAGANV